MSSNQRDYLVKKFHLSIVSGPKLSVIDYA